MKHFKHKPHKKMLTTYFGEAGVALPTGHGFVDGCSHMEEVSEDGVQQSTELFKESLATMAGAETADSVMAMAAPSCRLSMKARGKTESSDSAPVAHTLRRSKASANLEDDGATENLFAKLWGPGAADIAGDHSDDDAPQPSPKKAVARPRPRANVPSKLPSAPSSRQRHAMSTSKRVKEMMTSDKVVLEAKQFLQKAAHPSLVLRVDMKSAKAMCAKVAARQTPKLTELYLDDYQVGDEGHDGYTLMNTLTDLHLRLEGLGTFGEVIQQFMNDEVSSWLATTSRLTIVLSHMEDMKISVAKDASVEAVLNLMLKHHAAAFDWVDLFELLRSRPAACEHETPKDVDLQSLSQERQRPFQKRWVAKGASDLLMTPDRSGALTEYMRCYRNVFGVSSAQPLLDAQLAKDMAALEPLVLVDEDNVSLDKLVSAMSHAKDQSCILAQGLGGATGKLVLAHCDAVRLRLLRDAEMVKEIEKSEVPKLPSDSDPLLLPPKPWQAMVSSYHRIVAKASSHMVESHPRLVEIRQLCDKAWGMVTAEAISERKVQISDHAELIMQVLGADEDARIDRRDTCLAELDACLDGHSIAKEATFECLALACEEKAKAMEASRSTHCERLRFFREALAQLSGVEPLALDAPLIAQLVELLANTPADFDGVQHVKELLEALRDKMFARLVGDKCVSLCNTIAPFFNLCFACANWGDADFSKTDASTPDFSDLMATSERALQSLLRLTCAGSVASEPTFTLEGTTQPQPIALVLIAPRCYAVLHTVFQRGQQGLEQAQRMNRSQLWLQGLAEKLTEIGLPGCCSASIETLATFTERATSHIGAESAVLLEAQVLDWKVSVQEAAGKLTSEPLKSMLALWQAARAT